MFRKPMTFGLALFLTVCGGARADEVEALPSAVEIISEVLEESGIAAARVHFYEILKKRNECEVDADSLVTLGKSLQENGDFEKAEAVYAMALGAFPESTWLYRQIATARFAAGDEVGSLESMETMNKVDDERALETFLAGDHPQLLQTAEEVIQAHLDATGGLAAWRAIESIEARVGGYDSRGRLFRMVRQYKKPLKYRQQVEGSGRAMVTDGTRVWRVIDEGWTELEDVAFTHMASAGGWFLDPDLYGVTYEMLGFEFFHDAPVYRLRRTYATGREEELIFSADQGYLTEIYSVYPRDAPVMYSHASLWDYRPAGNVMVPYVFIRSMGSLGPPHGIVVEDVKINQPLDDSLFTPPSEDTDGGG